MSAGADEFVGSLTEGPPRPPSDKLSAPAGSEGGPPPPSPGRASDGPELIGWAVLELMGHRRLGGYVTEVTIGGHGFLRIDVPGEGGSATQYYPPASVYCLTPSTEGAARAVARLSRPAPVQVWELPSAEPRARPVEVPDDEDLDDDDEVDDEPF